MESATQMEVATVAMEGDAFEEHHRRLVEALACHRAPIRSGIAAATHRALALQASYVGDLPRAAASFAAVRALSPDYTPSTSLIPPGHPLQSAWQASAVLRDQRAPAPWNPPGGWYVDGVASNDLPLTRAYVLQAADASGSLTDAWYLAPGDALPTREQLTVTEPVTMTAVEPPPPIEPVVVVEPKPEAEPEPVVTPPTPPEEKPDRGKKRIGILVGSVALGLYGASIGGRVAYDANPSDGLRTLVNTTYSLSIAGAASYGAIVIVKAF